MKIEVISDLHGETPDISGGDILVVAGDCTLRNKVKYWFRFFDWLSSLPYKYKILIGGNHDHFLAHKVYEKDHIDVPLLKDPNFFYLENSGCTIGGIKFWGTPHTPWFRGVCPEFKKFMYDSEEKADKYFSQIPQDTDVLITHGPPRDILDQNRNLFPCGCHILRKHLERTQPKLHVFGHIHENGGQTFVLKGEKNDTLCANVAYLDENYQVRDGPARFEFKNGKFFKKN
jgi:Icc-related predicted phosphoesterase